MGQSDHLGAARVIHRYAHLGRGSIAALIQIHRIAGGITHIRGKIPAVNGLASIKVIARKRGQRKHTVIVLARDLLTVTGTGNFTGEAKIAYEIAVDKSGIEGLTIENVKSTDKENVEFVYNQLENAVKDLADEDKISEWNTLQSYCAAMRQRIEIVENQIEAFENKLGEYDINTVTSDDTADLESFQNSIGKFNNDYYDNLTDEQNKTIIDIYSAIEDLETRISDVAEEITRLTNAVNGYDEATVKSSDKPDVEQLIADIKCLTDGQNITADERASLEELNTKANLLAAKIRSTADEIARITRTVNAYSIDTVKSSDKADIENLIARIKKLTDGDNITADERANLNELDSTLDALLAKIDETADELARLEAEVGNYDEATVKSSDLDALNKLDSEIYALALTDNVTAEEKTKLNELHDKVFALITKVGNVSEEIVRIVDAIDAYVFESVKSSDKADIVKLIADIKALIDGDNITTDERAVLVKADQTADALLEKIAATAEEIKRIDNATNAYDISTVTSADKADIEKLLADSKALQDGDNITEAEEAALVENDATLNALLDRIAATTKEIERIDEAVNGYDEETVKSSDKDAINQLKEDIKALTDGDNLTDDERTALEANDEAIDELVEKLA
ncbi:MAG: hypothetical protein IJ261_03150, partial [Clostridia bacterium]|nr:hypothetical protein [Clostridia bacterium]